MKNSVIADTGFWYALIDKKDKYHELATHYLANCQERLITTWPVVTETSYMLLSRHSVEVASDFLEMGAEGMFKIHDLTVGHLQQSAVLMLKYKNLPMDLADASLVILAEELGHGRILSVDQRDFNTYRWKSQKPFTNLLFPHG
ncbi:MAG: PIN domain-containing protein [Candidatus Thiothrix sulfatifontis]|nr:MAG: PIN domain-containing protein [Candidatus Thiothrix sulfatifontis]